jgi:sulfate adenylyltransferase
MSKTTSIPHGGRLVDLTVSPDLLPEMMQEAEQLPVIRISDFTRSDVEMIGIGAFSPLTGFMHEKDYLRVLKDMRLDNGLIWSLPVTLPITNEQAKALASVPKVALVGEDDGIIYATMSIKEMYAYDAMQEAQAVFQTTDEDHPGVKRLLAQGNVYVAGPITLLQRKIDTTFADLDRTPKELRELFQEKGYATVVGFQTRNPIHRAHEYIQKTALETVDALLLHPLIGATKADDIPADVRIKSYRVLLENYYPKNRTVLSSFPASMRYAGPREAVFHALIRKNYGCTHFIVGRDHAGVGSYYGTYDAQRIFDQFDKTELGIFPLFFENSFYCTKCDGMASEKTCPHDEHDRITLSGTKVRAILRSGEKPSPKFSRPEVAQILVEGLHQN